MPVVYGLDVSDVSRWEETVLNPALQILDSLSKVRPSSITSPPHSLSSPVISLPSSQFTFD